MITILTKLKKVRGKSILLYYSVILSTILIIGGFWTARSGKEIVSNLLFLPVVVFLWLTLIQGKKENNLNKNDSKIKKK